MDWLHFHNLTVGTTSIVSLSRRQISQVLNCGLICALFLHDEPEWHHLRVFLGLNAAVDAAFSFIEVFTQVVGYLDRCWGLPLTKFCGL